MAPTYRAERDRGSKEFPEQLAVLGERWPLAFPTNREDVPPAGDGRRSPGRGGNGLVASETAEQLRDRVRAGLLRRRA
jgi:hypothetical protein